MAAYQYVYVMKDLTKAYPGGREVFKGITLSFLPDAKIGVLGPNGAGKSTLMRIMAGQDPEFGGEAWAAPGARVGYLSQEPHLDPGKTVGENVMEAFAGLKADLDRFNEISAKFAEPMDDEAMNALLAEQAELQERIDAANGWELDRRVEIALDALRCPPAESPVTKTRSGSAPYALTVWATMPRIEAASPQPRVTSPGWNQLKQRLRLLNGVCCGRTTVKPHRSASSGQPEPAA